LTNKEAPMYHPFRKKENLTSMRNDNIFKPKCKKKYQHTRNSMRKDTAYSNPKVRRIKYAKGHDIFKPEGEKYQHAHTAHTSS